MKEKALTGLIKRHPDGFGFFIPDDSEHPDVYIPRSSMRGVMTGDRVLVEAIQDKRDERYSGRILKISERGTKTLLGTFSRLNEHKGLIRDESKSWGDDLRIAISSDLKVEHGQLVTAEIISYPDEAAGFVGKITSIIGDAMDPLTDSKKVLIQQQIPHIFPQSVEMEASQIHEEVAAKDIASRKDLRKLNFVTIDGATAKDFDDAIYVEMKSTGFKLFVAIADVSHYVRPGSAIDQEAYLRGTSVYFPNFVVPMLPEVLSNGLCSLNPHVPRLALVSEIDMDFTGEIQKTGFYEATIESKARVTYGEAQDLIDGNKNPKLALVEKDILLAADLAKVLMAKRFREGSLDLEIPEVQMILNPEGIPTDFIRSERLFAHRLIEEMMLAANVAVAKFFFDREAAGIYRIHDVPNADAIEILESYLEKFGGSGGLQSKGKLQKRLTKALQEFEGKAESQILNILALRSMSQAKYSSNNIGHFGLGFEFYTHFTSPIRRYPDLIVHRILKSLIMPHSEYKILDDEYLQTAATMLSACEQRSVKAERQFVAIKKARFMQTHLGEEFEGIVSSVAKFGVFVLLRNFEVDGLIRLESLSKEPMIFDEERLVLFGKRSGKIFSVGDHLKIEVTDVDIDQGQVDFELVEVLTHVEAPQAPMKLHFKKDSRKDGRKDSRSREKEKGESKKNGFLKKDRTPDQAKKKSSKHSSQFQRSPKVQQPIKNTEPRSPGPKSLDMKSSEKNHHKANLSRKMATVRKHEESPDSKLLKYLDSKIEESKSTGQKFDPEKHFETALKKWKERNPGVSAKNPRREESSDGSRHDRRKEDHKSRETQRSEESQKSSPRRNSDKKSDKSFSKKRSKGRRS